MKKILLVLVSLAMAAAAAAIDGKWVSQIEMRGRGGDAAQKVEMTLDLKSDGDKLTGSIAMSTQRGNRENPIQDGKIAGDKFSFTTVQKGQQGEVKMKWTGTVKGDEITGERQREGANRSMPFTAKKKS